ncbi:DUF2795 domain-containing protein [Micromonospora sp. CPCC 206060]|uniref:DUF2795 domain-containing protein n=1 Tax=Micromonospora sp. CPCC 206060 TaxID=3122406 RepID=UPI002FF009AC
MERGSSKHGPRLDEQMSQEVKGVVQGTAGSRVDEFRQAEPAGEDQPEPTTAPAGELRTGAPKGMSSVDVEQRSRLGRYIGLSALPGDRQTLLRNAEQNEAPADILAELRRLPDGTEFQTVSEVWAALGHKNETSRW